MFAQQRRHRLLELLARQGRLTVSEIRDALDVSPATVRRDLAELADQGELVRVHGGAVHPAALHGEPVFQQRAHAAPKAKKTIAERAVEFAAEDCVAYIDAGTSALAVAQLLLPRPDVTMFTNSLPLLQAGVEGGAHLVATGGNLRVPSQSLVGALALDWMEQLRFDVAFIGASGLHAQEGASVTSLEEAGMKQAAMRRSGRTVLVADGEKWNAPAAVRFADWGQFDAWVTDKCLSPAERNGLTRRGVEVITVELDT
jgi:DeoR/GlpR family transcriptional regulator of sugar metabolism